MSAESDQDAGHEPGDETEENRLELVAIDLGVEKIPGTEPEAPAETTLEPTPEIPLAEGIRWLGPRAPAASEETLEYAAKGPLYTLTATLKRQRSPGGWSVEGQGSLKIPLGKKGQAGFASTWTDGANLFSSYREMGPSPVEWRRSATGLEVLKPEREPAAALSEENFAALGVPLLSAADLIFTVGDNWLELKTLGGAFFAVGSKIFALLLERKSEVEMEARLLPVSFTANERADEIFARLLWPEARTAQINWDPQRGAITSLRSRVPMLGQLRIDLVKRT